MTRVPKQSETKARVFEPAEGPRPVSAAPAPDAGLREALFDGVMELGCRHKADFEYGLVEPGECLIEVDRVLGVIEDVLASRQAEKETA